MQRAFATLGAVSIVVGGAVYYVHDKKRSDRARMHQGVLRDIAKELAEKEEAEAKKCEGGICDLSAGRFRDPNTGGVYTPPEATSTISK